MNFEKENYVRAQDTLLEMEKQFVDEEKEGRTALDTAVLGSAQMARWLCGDCSDPPCARPAGGCALRRRL